jgi:hypothetical protein
VLDSGDASFCTAVYEGIQQSLDPKGSGTSLTFKKSGHALEYSIGKSDQGGQEITDYLLELLKGTGTTFPTNDTFELNELARKIKVRRLPQINYIFK